MVKRVVAGFEKALWKAVHEEWPTVKMMGCAFHFTQSITKCIKQIELQTRYRNDREDKLAAMHCYLKISSNNC